MLKNTPDQIIRTSAAQISVIDKNIMYVLYNPDTLLETIDFTQTKEVYESLSKEQPLKILVDFPKYTTATDEARHWAENTKVEAIAGAIVFKTLGQRMLVRSYYLFHKQEHPVKIFTTKDKAIAWLNSLD